MPKKFEIFISYRRKGGYDTAKLLYDRLRMDGYSVSFDIDTLENGDFDNELEQRVYECKDFLLVLSPGIFDRFFDPKCDPKNDWVRREIVCALEKKKNVVPIFLDGFSYPENLPEDVKNITKKNGIDLNPKHFEGAYAQMKQKFLLSKPHFAKRYKKLIISILAVVIFGIAAGIFGMLGQKEQELQKERMERQRADSLKQAILDSIKNIPPPTPVLIPTPTPTPAPVQKAILQKPPQKSSEKSIHWSASNDIIGQVMYEKLASVGIKKTKCEGNGMVLKLNKPNCKSDNLAKIVCTYSPKITINNCNGKLIAVLDTPADFKTSPQTDEKEAKEELANDFLRSVNFGDWVLAIKKL